MQSMFYCPRRIFIGQRMYIYIFTALAMIYAHPVAWAGILLARISLQFPLLFISFHFPRLSSCVQQCNQFMTLLAKFPVCLTHGIPWGFPLSRLPSPAAIVTTAFLSPPQNCVGVFFVLFYFNTLYTQRRILFVTVVSRWSPVSIAIAWTRTPNPLGYACYVLCVLPRLLVYDTPKAESAWMGKGLGPATVATNWV